MPERSFGRTIRYRRTKLGLSQTKLGELVGRSATTIRAWERDQVMPNDPEVVVILAAVLGIGERVLFDKLDIRPPEMETSPTVEEVLAELAPDADGEEEPIQPPEPESVAASIADREPALPPESALAAEPVSTPEPARSAEPAFAPSSEPYVLTIPPPTAPEPSYIEDPRQRQLYRVRYLATAVALVALTVALLWALDRGLEAFSAWWDAFFANLRL